MINQLNEKCITLQYELLRANTCNPEYSDTFTNSIFK